MRQALDEVLRHRHPSLYANGPGFECGDGWFGLLDALSEVLVIWSAAARRKPGAISQIKEKFGTLRYYMNATEAQIGSIDLAEEMSARISEKSGRRGRLSKRGYWWFTRAHGEEPGAKMMGIGEFVDGRMGLPPLDITAPDMRLWRADVLEGPVDVPAGWLDLVDGLLREMGRNNQDIMQEQSGTRNINVSPHRAGFAPADPVRVKLIGATPDGLVIDYTGGGPRVAGLVAFAIAMSRRTDRETGDTGPVDDSGVMIR